MSMKFLKGFFKTVAVLFLIFGVGRYVLDSISMYNTLSTEQTYIENTFTDLHKADVETKVLFDEFADNLAYRKWANYFLTVRSNFDKWDLESKELKGQLVDRLGADTHAGKYIEALHSSYGTCCKPSDQKRWKVMGTTLGGWVKAMGDSETLPTENELNILETVLKDTARGKYARKNYDRNLFLTLVFYTIGDQGVYGLGLNSHKFKGLKHIPYEFTIEMANLLQVMPQSDLKILLSGYFLNMKNVNLKTYRDKACFSTPVHGGDQGRKKCLFENLAARCNNLEAKSWYAIANYFKQNYNLKSKHHYYIKNTSDINYATHRYDECIKNGYNQIIIK